MVVLSAAILSLVLWRTEPASQDDRTPDERNRIARDALVAIVDRAPPDVLDYAGRVMGCAHFGGEYGYDAERAAYIAEAMRKLRCDALEADGVALRRVHADDPGVLAVIALAEAG